jgi:hypothetical protein
LPKKRTTFVWPGCTMTSEARTITPMTIGTAITPGTELPASTRQAAMQIAMRRTPAQPVIVQAGRSAIVTRAPPWPTGVGGSGRLVSTAWLMASSRLHGAEN